MPIKQPTPWSLEGIKKFWPDEEIDALIPKNGFIHDFMLATRGYETPSIISFWTAIFLLSSTIKRDAWLKWFPFNLYPNFYIIVIAPPRINAKTTTARYGEKFLLKLPEALGHNLELKYGKEVNLLQTKVTPEAFAIALKPKKEEVVDPVLKKIIKLERDSEAALVIGELTTFLGKQKYNTGLIDRLTDLYDCKDQDSETTLTRGKLEFKNIFVTLFGATTMDGLRYSIPPEAMGGGFISRTILVYAPLPERVYPRPMAVKGGPSEDELTQRLAWVAENARGEYDLTEEADKVYDKWYRQFKKRLAGEGNKKKADIHHRYDINLLKLSLLLRAQKYSPGGDITIEEFNNAREILDFTYARSHLITQDVGESAYQVNYNKIRSLIEDKKTITRRAVLQRMSPYGCDTEQTTRILEHLYQSGLIKIKLNGDWQKGVSRKGQELYLLSEAIHG